MINLPSFDNSSIEWMLSSTMGDTYDRNMIEVVSRQLGNDAEGWRLSLSRRALFAPIIELLKSANQYQLELKAIYLRLLLELQILDDGILLGCPEDEIRKFASEIVEVDTAGFTEELFVTYLQIRARLMEPHALHVIMMELLGCGMLLPGSSTSRIRLIGSIASIGTEEAKEALYAIATSHAFAHEKHVILNELLMLRDARRVELEPEESIGGSNEDNWSRFAWSVYFDNEQGSLVSDVSAAVGWIGRLRSSVIVRPHLRYNRFWGTGNLQGEWWTRLLAVLNYGNGIGQGPVIPGDG